MKSILTTLLGMGLCILCCCQGLTGPGHVKFPPIIKATGTGDTPGKALEDAFQAAIQSALGAVVDSETLVRNNQVIRDEILVHSRGFVESHEVLSRGKNEDGLYHFVILAKVRDLKLYEQVRKFQPDVKKIDGAGLFGAVVSRMETRERGRQLLRKSLSRVSLPGSLLKLKLIDQQPRIIEEGPGLVLAEWRVQVSFDQEQYRRHVYPWLKQLLGQVATDQCLSIPVRTDCSRGASGYPLGNFNAHRHHHRYFIGESLPSQWNGKDSMVFLWGGWGLFGSMSTQYYDAYLIAPEIAREIALQQAFEPSIHLELLDKDHNPLISRTMKLTGQRDSSGWKIQGFRFFHPHTNVGGQAILPAFLLDAGTKTMQESYMTWIKQEVVVKWRERIPLETLRKGDHVTCKLSSM